MEGEVATDDFPHDEPLLCEGIAAMRAINRAIFLEPDTLSVDARFTGWASF